MPFICPEVVGGVPRSAFVLTAVVPHAHFVRGPSPVAVGGRRIEQMDGYGSRPSAGPAVREALAERGPNLALLIEL